MIDLLNVILLGIIEGITEFLPISSTGHLLIAEKFGLGARSDLFNIGIQAGAILAVTLIYWKRIWQLLTQWREPANRDYLLKLVVAFAITAVLGFVAVKLGFKLPETVTPVAWALVIGGLWMIAAERLAARQPERSEVTWRVAILVGIAQMIAGIFPGTSRSAQRCCCWCPPAADHAAWASLTSLSPRAVLPALPAAAAAAIWHCGLLVRSNSSLIQPMNACTRADRWRFCG